MIPDCAHLVLPAVCAPMFRASSPALVREACKGGLVGALPRQNARDFETFDAWLGQIGAALKVYAEENPHARTGPVAVNLSRLPGDQMAQHLAVCRKHGVELIGEIPSAAELGYRLRRGYVAACQIPEMADVARLVDQAGDSRSD